MDIQTATNIITTVVLATTAKRLFELVISHSPTAARRVKTALTNSLKNHWRILLVFLNCIFVLSALAYLVLEAFDPQPATRRFVALVALMSTQFIPCVNDAVDQFEKYKKAIGRT